MRTFFAFLAFAIPAAAPAQVINVPAQVIDGAPVALTVRDLTPGSKAELLVRRVTEDGNAFESRSSFMAGPDGAVDPTRDSAIEGDYRGVDPAGPFWSMRPIARSATDRGTIRVQVCRDGQLLAERAVPLRALTEGVTVEDIGDFPGARLYRPDKNKRAVPVIIVLGGSEGGSSGSRANASRLAGLGYATLALPYYNPQWSGETLPGLPAAFVDIAVDKLEAVKRWIDRQPDLNRRRIGLYGVSKGGEFAMIAASRFSWLRAVIGIVPSDVVWEGWGTNRPDGTTSSFAWRGKALPFVSYQGMTEAITAIGRGGRRSLTLPHLDGRRVNPARAAAARIPVERFAGAMLIAGGDKDATWPSGEMTRAIAERRAAYGLTTLSLTYADAGHGLSGTGWLPINYDPADTTVPATARAQREIWRAVRDFLGKHLPTPSRNK